MKKQLSCFTLVIVTIALCSALMGCSDEKLESPLDDLTPTETSSPLPDDTVDSPDQEEAESPATEEVIREPRETLDLHTESPKSGELHDLNGLSDTVLNVEVTAMLVDPESYLGITVSLPGEFQGTTLERSGLYHPYILVQDYSGCCQNAVELVLSDELAGSDNVPEEDTEVIITGTFASYEMSGQTFYCIAVDELTLKS